MPSSWGRWGATPLWATVGRLSSADSKARFTQRSRIDLFHDGSCWRRMSAHEGGAGGVGACVVGGGGVVVGAPHCDRRVVAEQVDRLAGLAHSLLADGAGVAPLQREVLPHQHAEFVGGGVELGPGDVPVDPHQVEPGLACELHIVAHLGGRGLGEGGTGGGEVGALHEQGLPVHREHPVLQCHLAQPGAHFATVAGGLVDQHLDGDIGEVLLAQAPRPPQAGIVDIDVPVDLVRAPSPATSSARPPPPHPRWCARPRCGNRRRRGGHEGAGGHGHRWRRDTAPAAGRCAPARLASTLTGRHRPPGFHAGSIMSEC